MAPHQTDQLYGGLADRGSTDGTAAASHRRAGKRIGPFPFAWPRLRPLFRRADVSGAGHLVKWALIDQAMISAVNFSTGILLARSLGITEFGRFTLAWMIVLLVLALQHATINSPMMSIGPRQPSDERPRYFGAVATHQTAFAVLSLSTVWLLATVGGMAFPSWGIGGLATALTVATVVVQAHEFLRRYFFTQGRGARAFTIDGVRYLGQLAVLGWIVHSGSISPAAAIWAIAAVATISALVGACLTEAMQLEGKTISRVARRHWAFSKWLLGSTLMQWATAYLYMALAGVMLGPAAVGALRAAQNLMGFAQVLFQGLETSIPVRAAARLHEGGKAALVRFLRHVSAAGGLSTVAVTFPVAVFSEFFLHTVFGEQFVGYGELLWWFAAANLFIFLSVPLSATIRAMGQTRYIFRGQLAGSCLAAIAVYPLIANFGLSGAASALMLSYITLCAFLLIVVSREFRHAASAGA